MDKKEQIIAVVKEIERLMEDGYPYLVAVQLALMPTEISYPEYIYLRKKYKVKMKKIQQKELKYFWLASDKLNYNRDVDIDEYALPEQMEELLEYLPFIEYGGDADADY